MGSNPIGSANKNKYLGLFLRQSTAQVLQTVVVSAGRNACLPTDLRWLGLTLSLTNNKIDSYRY